MDQKKIVYGGVFIDSEAKERLKKYALRIMSSGNKTDKWIMTGDHLTIYFHTSENAKCKEWVNANIGKPISLKITAIGASDKAIAALVNTDEVPCDNKIKHITLAYNSSTGGKPVDSNNIEKWFDLRHPITVNGVVGVLIRGKGIITTI